MKSGDIALIYRRQEKLAETKKTREGEEELARKAANIFFATHSYHEVISQLCLSYGGARARQRVMLLLSTPAALRELDLLREQMRKRSLISREDAICWLMRCLELEPGSYMSERTEIDAAGKAYTVQFVDFKKLKEAENGKYVDRVEWDSRGRAKGSFVSKLDAFKRLCEMQGWDAPKKYEVSAADPKTMSLAQLEKLRDAAVHEKAMELVAPLLQEQKDQSGQDSVS